MMADTMTDTGGPEALPDGPSVGMEDTSASRVEMETINPDSWASTDATVGLMLCVCVAEVEFILSQYSRVCCISTKILVFEPLDGMFAVWDSMHETQALE